MGKGGSGSTEIKETSQEIAAAEIAGKQWQLYQNELKPMENLFISKVDAMNNESNYDDAAGTVNLGYQQEFGKARQQTATGLAASGVDPSSGKFQSALGDIQSDQVAGQIDTTNRAQTSQQDKYVAGLQDVVAMGAGQKADALSGYSNIANQSLSKATSDAQNSLSDRQAVGQLVGAVGGVAARSYGLKDASSKSTGIFGGS
ncbi:hypothetical protein BZ17_655 [Yersinia pseudotuberculosis IP 32953]|uniref:Uncharacterized protein n=1 Tax=Yersinia pseudotuberculosis serotype I (strain IP32953) TaxID=273123 RepID=Q66BE4_YERPS|nr:hypothetical protein [Yersinia pseudotuberculosis]AJJ53503.1 hypothetical protein BZ17_655 [Yersinia pseudotuberculosis IP 32953]KGA61261.1 hypothetical protein DJ55_313 [Yersinia pseudotuberculosis]PSH41679.1 hypothetical protein BA193_16730 [Yersinia pseudotuberculosis]PSH45610.1 hypothetical protein BA194_18235 [Yersinia pseudotuberculosis]CAH21066.1 bacteriophage hypothetical protein [Yersinia pseudotuberculosis IP 32953]